MAAHRSPLRAAFLSLIVPGLGQCFLGDRAKGAVILCIDAGILLGIAIASIGPEAFRSWLTVVMLGVAYVFVWIPAVVDAYQRAKGLSKPLLSGERLWYVVFMLLTVGPAAIPLLWQSPRFSRSAKIGWTIAVILIALSLVVFTLVVGPMLERLSDQLPELLNTLR